MNSKFPVLTTGTYDPAGVGGVGNFIPNDSSFSSIKTIVSVLSDFSFYMKFFIKKILRF